MRVLVCASGTIGDVHPLVAVAVAMRNRGHEVILLANEAYRKLAIEAGIGFDPVDAIEDLDKIKQHPRIWDYSLGWKLWIRGAGIAPMRRLFDLIKKWHQPGNTIVAHSYLCFGARVAQEVLPIPTATMHLNVHTIRTVYGVYAYPPPSFLPDWIPRSYVTSEWYPVWYRKMNLALADKAFIDPVMKKEIVAFRTELGLPRLKTFIRDWWNSPDQIIGLYPDWWAGPHPDWPQQVETTGFPFWDRQSNRQVEPEIADWIEKSEQLIVCSPGASAGHHDGQFQAFEYACEQLKRPGIFITPDIPDRRTEYVRYTNYVPFRDVLDRTSLMVHHAGIGTSAHCLAAGVPQVVIPTLYNQPDTAIRMERLGVARQLSAKTVTGARLLAAMREMIESETVQRNCLDYRTRMAEEKSLPKVCDILEQLQTSE